jgi:hypothetical protein
VETNRTESNRNTDARHGAESQEPWIELTLDDLAQVGGGIIKHIGAVTDGAARGKF